MSELKEKQNEFREQKTRKLEEQVQDLNKRLSNNTDGHQQEIRRLNQEFSSTRIQDSAQISELKKQKEALEQKTRKLEEDVQDLNKRHSNITEGHQKAISLLKQDLSSTRLSDNAHTSELKKVKEALEQKARKLEEQVQILNNRLSSKTDEHQQEVRQLNQDLGSIRTKANGNISVLKSQKEDLEQKTNTLENEVQDLKNRLSSITDSHQQEVNRLTQELNSSRMETNGQVSGLEREKETLGQRNNYLEQQVQSLEYRMSMQDSKISGNQGLIDDYKQQISKYQQQIECYQNPISYLFACTTCSNTIVTCVPRNSTPMP
ncbi:myosin-10-like [Mytilus californianus]|uniref:myosin-10-like n=1 Tax=Mytilus californianus TaxID=6549 RepID=UPI0022459666|nr:myosin-10-like [Mytilus californianus]